MEMLQRAAALFVGHTDAGAGDEEQIELSRVPGTHAHKHSAEEDNEEDDATAAGATAVAAISLLTVALCRRRRPLSVRADP